MAEIKRATLFGKLNSLGYKTIESATVFCKMRGNPYVETVHWLHQLLQLPDSDVHRIIKHFQLDPSRLATDLIGALDKLPRGATAISDFSPHIEAAVERGWVFGSLLFGEYQVRTGYLIVGFLKSENLRNVFLGLSRELAKIKLEALTDEFAKIVGGSPEEALRASDGSGLTAGAAPGETSGAIAPAAMGKQEALARFSVDLTEKARKGELDPIVGRDEEIRQIVDILMRRRQNNPLLTGEAGVGKTAVVEGFALRIVAGDVPPAIKDVSLRTLDLGLLQAGAGVKGEFENRLKSVIQEVKASPKPIILFIDEAHTIIGAGGSAGQGDAANLLKPALARGELRTIAATTWAEYKKYFEKDAALARRFQVVKVEEPTDDQAIGMMRGLAETMENHHKVRILEEAVEDSVKLSRRYITGRQLPDKAVSVLDTACARLALGQNAIPPAIEDATRTLDDLGVQTRVLQREAAVGSDHAERLASIATQKTTLAAELKTLQERREKEVGLVGQIRNVRTQLETAAAPRAAAGDGSGSAAQPALDTAALRADLTRLNAELDALQGENPLMRVCVDTQIVGEVISAWTGIPVGTMQQDEINTVLSLKDLLAVRV